MYKIPNPRRNYANTGPEPMRDEWEPGEKLKYTGFAILLAALIVLGMSC